MYRKTSFFTINNSSWDVDNADAIKFALICLFAG
jgi:hypothetical protein